MEHPWVSLCSEEEEEEEDASEASMNNNNIMSRGNNSSSVTTQPSHRVKEKRRREQLNHLYDSLRRLFPRTKKKLSVPAAVCAMLRYIPNLQQEAENLGRHRDELVGVRRICEQADSMARLGTHLHTKRVYLLSSHLSPNVSISASAMAPCKFVILVQTHYKARLCFPALLILFEEESLHVSHASSFLSPHKAWYSVHAEAADCMNLDANLLRIKILLLCQDRDCLL